MHCYIPQFLYVGANKSVSTVQECHSWLGRKISNLTARISPSLVPAIESFYSAAPVMIICLAVPYHSFAISVAIAALDYFKHRMNPAHLPHTYNGLRNASLLFALAGVPDLLRTRTFYAVLAVIQDLWNAKSAHENGNTPLAKVID